MKDIKTNNRRKRSLERNRVAASKCRKRKNKWINNLEEMKVGLEALHSVLQSEHMDLLQESCQLKNYLICHATCHNPNIDEWINNEALKYVRKLSDLPQVSCLESPSPMASDSILMDSWINSQNMEPLPSSSSTVHSEDSNSDEIFGGEDAFPV